MTDWHPRDDDIDDFEGDPLQEAMDECGFLPDEGICMLAGTEWCDWDCPFNPTDPTT
jgi:hypothetical protein